MAPHSGFILSASRRTDIPAFYLDWFMDSILKKSFDVKNPYSKAVKQVCATPDAVAAIVFWSKNFDRFIASRAGETLTSMGYRLFFNFSINSESLDLEPNVPPLDARLKQLEYLARTFGPGSIAWRFDPICFFNTRENGQVHNNLTDLFEIAQRASTLGVKKCVTSFFDRYAKIDRRLKKISKTRGRYLRFVDPSLEKKVKTILTMAETLAKADIGLHLCSEQEVFENLPPFAPVTQNACIDGPALQKLFNRTWPIKRDYGQRSEKGCQCSRSIDIGSYDEHPCPHDCIFCFAHPVMDS